MKKVPDPLLPFCRGQLLFHSSNIPGLHPRRPPWTDRGDPRSRKWLRVQPCQLPALPLPPLVSGPAIQVLSNRIRTNHLQVFRIKANFFPLDFTFFPFLPNQPFSGWAQFIFARINLVEFSYRKSESGWSFATLLSYSPLLCRKLGKNLE